MIEDITDYDGSNGMYKQQAPLRPPPMNPPTSIRGSIISPRFDNIATRSSTLAWSPAPFNGGSYEKQYVDPYSTSQTFAKSSEPWPNNNVPTRSSGPGTNNNVHTKSSDSWLNHNTQSKTSELWSPSNGFKRAPDSTITSNNSSNVPMIKNSDSTCGCITNGCSPRCKLGILGFIIGFLVVGIALAVVLVLWLRN